MTRARARLPSKSFACLTRPTYFPLITHSPKTFLPARLANPPVPQDQRYPWPGPSRDLKGLPSLASPGVLWQFSMENRFGISLLADPHKYPLVLGGAN